jgi:alkanesulfonate monooxygenase SsuD/methylene tetrahydromethanopterin reductase-like flavin-dependent oxidoreductase (luciferase family)
MTERNGVSFGVKTSQMGLTYDEILAVWRVADRIPIIEHAWLWDHMVPLRGDARADALEAWTLLAALAAQTTRLQLGVIVTSNRLRPPAVLAKMAATTDIIAGGRLVFGIGAGAGLLPPEHPHAAANPSIREFQTYGIPLVPVAEAIADLAEACTIVRRMWTEQEPFDFDGSAYHDRLWWREAGAPRRRPARRYLELPRADRRGVCAQERCAGRALRSDRS